MYCMMTSSKNSLFFLNCHTCQYFFHWTRTHTSIYGLQHDNVIQRILMFLLAFEDSNEIRTLKFSMKSVKDCNAKNCKLSYLLNKNQFEDVWSILKHIYEAFITLTPLYVIYSVQKVWKWCKRRIMFGQELSLSENLFHFAVV